MNRLDRIFLFTLIASFVAMMIYALVLSEWFAATMLLSAILAFIFIVLIESSNDSYRKYSDELEITISHIERENQTLRKNLYDAKLAHRAENSLHEDEVEMLRRSLIKSREINSSLKRQLEEKTNSANLYERRCIELKKVLHNQPSWIVTKFGFMRDEKTNRKKLIRDAKGRFIKE